MASDIQWFEKPLGEVTVNHDGKRRPVKESERKKGPFPYYGASGIVDYVDGYLFEGRHLLIAEDGENLRTRQTPIAFMADGKFWVNNHAHIVTGKGEVTTEYLHYFLQNADIQSYLTGAVMPKLTQGNLNRIPVRYPDPESQRSIVQVLGSLDAKIDLNRRINQTLETMAQAIFQSWFVDFDPVKAKIAAKAEGRDPLRAAMSALSGKGGAELDALPPEQYEQLAANAALFPDEMEESELGEIPKGWSVQRVGGVIELAYGKALKSTDRQEGNVPVYGSGGITGHHNMPLVPNGSIIVGRKGTVGSLYWEDKPFFPIDTTYYVRPLAAPLTFCFYAMQTMGLEKMNTDAAVPGLNRENVYRLELVLPDSTALQQFDIQVVSLRNAMRSNLESSQSLAHLRDALLPKLLSGELSVADAMAEAEA
ncbi:restriction endonuclease subunit S [Paracidovorax sp. MALMAid1276]|uniref:restriction endonuclease subunit S n=1 Tax=Paracidovorax sp. MALMAid1276 TaxID=3411631 RepID=UPI003B9B4DC4